MGAQVMGAEAKGVAASPIQPGSYRFPVADGVVFGKPWRKALAAEVARGGFRRVFALVSGTLATAQQLEAGLRAALGDAFQQMHAGIGAHSPRQDVLAATRAARACAADVIVAIGGGSVIDAAKVMQLALAADVDDVAGFDAIVGAGKPVHGVDLPVRVIALPSTLSGAEFTAFAGVTDTKARRKQMYLHRQMTPLTVILDAALTCDTPQELWLSTGIRAVDHAVEDLCSINAQPLADAASTKALSLLARALPATKRDPADLAARLDAMVGVWLSMVGTQGGVEKGVSHAIGHILGGTFGVAHGVTSCITLPHVLRWNAPVNAAIQADIASAMGRPGGAAANVVAELIHGLDLPHTLGTVGVSRDQGQLLAELTMTDPWTLTNPRKVRGPEDVLEILRDAW